MCTYVAMSTELHWSEKFIELYVFHQLQSSGDSAAYPPLKVAATTAAHSPPATSSSLRHPPYETQTEKILRLFVEFFALNVPDLEFSLGFMTGFLLVISPQ